MQIFYILIQYKEVFSPILPFHIEIIFKFYETLHFIVQVATENAE